jgi:hypothetical protein
LPKKQAILDERNKHLPTNINPTPEVNNFKPNIVEVVDKSYIDRRFKASSKNDEKIVADSISKFKLNSEQKRAFRIISNHAMMEKPDKLCMYLGGMGGTGKSQVIISFCAWYK